MKYPHNEESTRPYRLWDAKAKAAMPYRYYKHYRRAHLGALIECRWAKVGTTIEVFNTTNGRLLGQYYRGVDGIKFSGGSNA